MVWSRYIAVGVLAAGASLAHADEPARRLVPQLSAPVPLSTAQVPVMGPRFSPDGLRLLVTDPDGNGLATLPLAGGPPRWLNRDLRAGIHAQWNSDGQSVTYLAVLAQEPVPYTVDLAGRTGRATFDPRGAQHPDGQLTIVPENELLIMRGPKKTGAVSPAGERCFGPRFSPDGRFLVFTGVQSGLILIDLEVGDRAFLGPGTHPVWLPDSAGFLYDRIDRDGDNILSSELWFVDVATRTRTQLTHTPDRAELRPTLSPRRNADGSYSVVFDDLRRLFSAQLAFR